MKIKKQNLLTLIVFSLIVLSGADSAVFQTSSQAAQLPPSVQITFPANNDSYNLGRAVFLAADASSDSPIVRVEFYDGATLIGSDTSAPYQIGWNYPTGGTHVVTAKAFDAANTSATSAPVNITVVSNGGPAPLPVATSSLIAPANGATYEAPATITISANAAGGSQGVNRVDFFLNTTLVGTDNTPPYSVTVTNVPAGRYAVFARTTAGNGVQAISQGADIVVNAPVVQNRSLFDFDGDNKTDISIFRPSLGEWWYLRSSNGGNYAAQFGASSDKLTPADFTGDGKTDVAFFRSSTGEWFVLRSENGSFYSFPFGTSGDIPAVGDFDADGKADAAVFRPSDATWYIRRSTDGGTTIQQFGQTGDVPVVSDYDGDGKADIAIYRVASGEWWIQKSTAGLIAFQFGSSTDKPVQGDYTGDGKSDVAIWRPSTGEWFVLRSENQSFYSFPFGTNGDIPALGDYDGDGRIDATVFRPSNNTWYSQRTTAGTLIQSFGQTGDVPVPGAFVP